MQQTEVPFCEVLKAKQVTKERSFLPEGRLDLHGNPCYLATEIIPGVSWDLAYKVLTWRWLQASMKSMCTAQEHICVTGTLKWCWQQHTPVKKAISNSEQGILTDVLSRSKEIVMWKQEHFNHPHKAQRCQTSAELKSESTIWQEPKGSESFAWASADSGCLQLCQEMWYSSARSDSNLQS